MMHLQLLNDSISRFNENFGAFLYGMNMTAFCVDFPEAPIQQSYARHKGEYNPLDDSPFRMEEKRGRDGDIEATFMTSDTSGFVDNPEPSTIKKSTVSSKFSSVPGSMSKPSQFNARGGRGVGSAAGRGVAGTRGTAAAGRARGSGIARGSSSSRGTAGTRGSGIARGVGRAGGVR